MKNRVLLTKRMLKKSANKQTDKQASIKNLLQWQIIE